MKDAEKIVLVVIVTEAVMESTLVSDFHKRGVKGYTIVNARGQGSQGTRAGEWDTGSNIRIEVLCSKKFADELMSYLREQYYDNYAMITYCVDVTVLRNAKFQ